MTSVFQQQSAAAAAAPEPARHVMPPAEGELVGRGRQKTAPPPATMEGIAGFGFCPTISSGVMSRVHTVLFSFRTLRNMSVANCC